MTNKQILNDCPDGGHCLNEDVIELARELAKTINRSAIKWDVITGFVCKICGAKSVTNSMDADGDLSSLIHVEACPIARARRAGLLETSNE